MEAALEENDVLALPDARREAGGEGVDEQTQVLLGPLVLVEVTEGRQEEVVQLGMKPRCDAHLRELGGREQLQEEQVDALGEVGDVARVEGDADEVARGVQPERVGHGRLLAVELEVPAEAED